MSGVDCGHRHTEQEDCDALGLVTTSLETTARPMSAYSQSAPFMTNANYRIIPPTPEPHAADDGTSPSTAFSATASRLPAWISPSTQSRTYFPASSPIIDGGCVLADEDQPYSGGALGHQQHRQQPDSPSMLVNSAQEMRTEYDLLPYEIHSWSSHSANFLPNNILVDRPHDQASRWSTVVNNHRQFITLRLERPALVRSIKFGKFYKKFKVFGGMTEDNMVELLYSGLRNDSEPEVISLKQKVDGHRIMSDFDMVKRQEVVRSCLRFFRDHGYTDAFRALERQANVQLEIPLLAEIHKALVETRDYDRVETLLFQAEREGMFQNSTEKIPYAAAWRPTDLTSYTVPSARGGHQMCVDEESRYAYLYGGWDGTNNLGDLWMLSLDSGQWSCISSNTQDQGGPGPRSCHAMCFDSAHKCIYIMGKYVDHEYRGNTGLDNELYCYDTLNGEWIVLSENTEIHSGPKLLFNAQMVFDPRFCSLYVYGGKVVLPDANDSTIIYSGLYRYDLRKHRWTRLKPDFHMLEQEQHVRGRYFHSMSIDPELQRLYILSSKRDVSTPGDLFIYDIATNTFYERMANLAATSPSKQPMTQQTYLSEQQRLNPTYAAVQAQMPLAASSGNDHHPHHVHVVQDGRTVRTTLDVERQELYVLASAQNDSLSGPPGSLMQNLMSIRGARGMHSGPVDSGSSYFMHTTASQIQAAGAGAGFHPCSSLMDSGVRYDSGSQGYYGASARSGTQTRDGSRLKTGSADRLDDSANQRPRFRLPTDHILMVVFCYHIPTETWTEVHNSARAADSYTIAMNDPHRSSDSGNGSGNGGLAVSLKRSNSQGSIMPPFPLPRYAQAWVYDKANHRHLMFGGNPSRPNDKSARFSDTWELKFARPDAHDILRRALYLVRQRRFLDMCVGLCPSEKTDSAARTMSELKASAIPSPKTAMLGSPDPGSPNSKRSSPLSASGDIAEHQSQRQRVGTAASVGPSSSATSATSAIMHGLVAAPPAQSSNVSDALSVSASCSSLSDSVSSSVGNNGVTASFTTRALDYLQQHIAPLVNYDDPSECQSFHALSTALFQISASGNGLLQHSPDALRSARANVYEALLVYFSECPHHQQPKFRMEDVVATMLE
ncbi:hypothetical protein H4R99_002594 [Coemansia sp. RSA 1722]|nr:hypothetical protein H4R99_002594 [Coemansia sp. RSA 1722]